MKYLIFCALSLDRAIVWTVAVHIISCFCCQTISCTTAQMWCSQSPSSCSHQSIISSGFRVSKVLFRIETLSLLYLCLPVPEEVLSLKFLNIAGLDFPHLAYLQQGTICEAHRCPQWWQSSIWKKLRAELWLPSQELLLATGSDKWTTLGSKSDQGNRNLSRTYKCCGQ